MGSEGTDLEAHLRSFLHGVQSEAGVLDRVVYKHKNQHRRCPYFHSLLKVRRDVKLLLSARPGEVLSNLFPIVNGRRPAYKAYAPMRLKRNSSAGKYNYLEGLLGIARLLSQMAEPVLKAAMLPLPFCSQISLLLAKSFFTAFCVTVLAVLARLRVLVQQMLLDVVVVFNKVASLSRKKHSIKLINEGIEAYREYYPSGREIPMLECIWDKDKFVLLERTHDTSTDNQVEDQEALCLETSIHYETIELFNEVSSTEHELSSEKLHRDVPLQGSSTDKASMINCINIVDDSNSGNQSVGQKLPVMEQASRGDPLASIGSLTSPRTVPETKVAFVPVRKSGPSTSSSGQPNKKIKFDLPLEDAAKPEDPFLHLLIAGSMKDTLF